MDNTVFQGGVLGPPLWNIFFSDIGEAIPEDFEEEKFADDLTIDREFDDVEPNMSIYGEVSFMRGALKIKSYLIPARKNSRYWRPKVELEHPFGFSAPRSASH